MAAEQPTEITITASGEMKVVVEQSAYGTPIEMVTLTRHVRYAFEPKAADECTKAAMAQVHTAVAAATK